MRPGRIIKHLKLRTPCYQKTASYGHFGREDENFTWEQLDKVDILRRVIIDIYLFVIHDYFYPCLTN